MPQLDGCNTVNTGLPVIDVIVLVLHSFHCNLTWSLESGISFRDKLTIKGILDIGQVNQGLHGQFGIPKTLKNVGKEG